MIMVVMSLMTMAMTVIRIMITTVLPLAKAGPSFHAYRQLVMMTLMTMTMMPMVIITKVILRMHVPGVFQSCGEVDLHEKWEIPGDDLPTHSHRLMPEDTNMMWVKISFESKYHMG